ncbi:hypothetical protein SRABI128_04978 [Microbacterium sp. Bi128]|nr:hypothetical protein SRABI128_04978 [Microbacterium sp. Bi128]
MDFFILSPSPSCCSLSFASVEPTRPEESIALPSAASRAASSRLLLLTSPVAAPSRAFVASLMASSLASMSSIVVPKVVNAWPISSSGAVVSVAARTASQAAVWAWIRSSSGSLNPSGGRSSCAGFPLSSVGSHGADVR